MRELTIVPAFHLYALTFMRFSTIFISVNSYSDEEPLILQGPYVGQKLPALIPEVFSPGIASTEYRDWGGSFTPDMKAYYFGRTCLKSGETKRFAYKLEDNQWRLSEVASHMGSSLSPDGKTMFSGYRFRKLTERGWSELKSLGSPFEDYRIMRLTALLNGTLVFDEATRDGNGVLRYSRLINGKRESPKPLSREINTGKWTAHPFIAPDESYIIWDSEREGGYGDSDMYISFRRPDGSRGKAINFGEKINTDGEDGGGNVTPDGKYLFYCRRCAPPDFDVMWVDAQIIENLRLQY